MSEKYQNCPMCGSLCTIGGDKKEGTHYYVPVGDKTHTTDETQPSSEAYEARIDELTAFVEEVAKLGESEGLVLSISEDARALLRGKSEEGK